MSSTANEIKHDKLKEVEKSTQTNTHAKSVWYVHNNGELMATVSF